MRRGGIGNNGPPTATVLIGDGYAVSPPPTALFPLLLTTASEKEEILVLV